MRGSAPSLGGVQRCPLSKLVNRTPLCHTLRHHPPLLSQSLYHNEDWVLRGDVGWVPSGTVRFSV